MPKLTKAQMMKRLRAERKALGFDKIEVILVSNTEARADLKMYVSYLNQKYNIMKIGE